MPRAACRPTASARTATTSPAGRISGSLTDPSAGGGRHAASRIRPHRSFIRSTTGTLTPMITSAPTDSPRRFAIRPLGILVGATVVVVASYAVSLATQSPVPPALNRDEAYVLQP